MCCGLAGSINNTTNKLRRRAGKIVGSVKITNPLKKDFVCSCNVFEREKNKSGRHVRSRTHWGKMGLAKGSSFVVDVFCNSSMSTCQDLINRPYATGRLKDSGRQNDEKMSRQTGNAL